MAWVSIGWIGAMIMAYLVGSIPSAYLAGRLLKGKDIREEGDRNPGAANAYRSIGSKVGLAVGAADIAKGAIAVLIAKLLTGSTGAEMTAGVLAVAGHNWPIFLQFRGGRGGATTVGVLMALVPVPGIPVSLAAVALLPIIKSATIALSMVMVPMALLAWLTGASYPVVAYCVGLPVMAGVRHHLTSKKLQTQQEDPAVGQPLPEG